MLPIALAASIALPFYAFYSGHPFRIRYEVPLILGGAACIGAAVLDAAVRGATRARCRC